MAAGQFLVCLPCTLREEGGLSYDAGDPGGLTKWGVTHKTYDSYRSKKGFYLRSVAKMTQAEMQEIYRTYWDAIRAEDLAAGVDLSAFDYAVNSGPGKARAALAWAGAGDRKATVVIDAIASERLSVLHALSTWRRFGKGWGARVARIEAASLKMAGASLAIASGEAATKRNAAVARAKRVIASSGVGSVASAGAAHQAAGAGDYAWIAVLVIAAMVGGGLVACFKAWRLGQRAAVLAEAASATAAQSVPANARAAAANASTNEPPQPAAS